MTAPSILNYTTSVSAHRSAMEIQRRLVQAKAQAVMSEFDDSGMLTHISFRIRTAHGLVSFRLPANVDGVYRVLRRSPRAKKTRDHAANVAWRICKDWVEAQLAIVQAEMASLPEVFLPYAQTASGEMVYEQFEKRGMLGLNYHPNGGES